MTGGGCFARILSEAQINRKKLVATMVALFLRLQRNSQQERDFFRKRRNSVLGEFFLAKKEQAILRLFRRGGDDGS